jgi:hypothetical protein
MHIVKRVGVMSVAKIMGLVYACMGLIFAPFFLLFGLLGSLMGEEKTPFAGIFGVVFAILMPLVYGILGFIAGALGAALYNFFAKLVGGVEVELDLRAAGPPAPYPIVPPPTPNFNS